MPDADCFTLPIHEEIDASSPRHAWGLHHKSYTFRRLTEYYGRLNHPTYLESCKWLRQLRAEWLPEPFIHTNLSVLEGPEEMQEKREKAGFVY